MSNILSNPEEFDDTELQRCEMCGCLGNMSCGHEPLNDYHGCALDQSLVCACCVEKANEEQ